MLYKEIRERNQQEVNALPLGFAFSDKQFEDMMKKWGLDPKKDLKKIYSIGAGGFIQKKDAALLDETFTRHNKEHEHLLLTDDEYVLSAFDFELANHEYGYTGELQPALSALGLSYEKVSSDKRLLNLLNKARKRFHV